MNVVEKLIPAILGGGLGFIVWKTDALGVDFGFGPFLFIIICAVGGMAVANKL